MDNLIKRAVSRVTSDPAILALVDALVFRLVARTNVAAKWNVLIAAPGAGNIGDQAMFEAFLENASGPVALIVRDVGDVHVSSVNAERVTVFPLASLIYGGGISHVRDVVTFRKILMYAKSLSIVGADIMDGAYNYRASVNRSTLARLTQELGINTRILGFSWNGRADRRARAALSAASASGVALFLRDPISAERARNDGLSNVVAAADTVFSATEVSADGIDVLVPGLSGASYALVNASALIGKTVDQLVEYREIIAHLRRHGISVVLLPHVARGQGGDINACRQIYESVAGENIFMVDKLLSPAQVRTLSGGARLVITGRMHLAIISLSNAVPAITLATQGKVEGLMRLFGIPTMCVVPKKGFSDDVIRATDEILMAPNEDPINISGSLAQVKALSKMNFSGLN